MAQIFIIDDDMMVSRVLEEHLLAEGHQVKSFSMAEEGFQAAIKTPPDLFLIDVMLPDATGFQMVGRFRQHPQTHDVPIIMMSGTARHQNQKDIGRDMGADDYLVKPIDAEMVSTKISHLLTSKPKHTAVAFGTEPTPSSSPEPEPIRQTPLESFPEVHTPIPTAAPLNGNDSVKDFQLPEFEYTEKRVSQDMAPLEKVEKPVKQKMEGPSKARWALGLFALHMILAVGQGWKSQQTFPTIVRAASGVAAGWILLLGLMVGICAALEIFISADQALSLLFWPAIPILARAIAALCGFSLDPQFATPGLYWLRPLDVFELAAILILGISLRRRPGSSLTKVISVCVLLAVGWCLTNRGYFQP